MDVPASDSSPAGPTIDAPSTPPPDARGPSLGQGRLLAIALAAGLLAGVAAWLAGEAIFKAFEAELSPRIRREVDAAATRRFARAHLMRATGTFAGLGAMLGLSLGLAGGLVRSSVTAGAKAALVGGVVGFVTGAAGAQVIVAYFYKTNDPQSHSLVLPLLTQSAICALVGAAGGLAFGVGLGGRGRWIKPLVGGLIGAALGAAAYEIVGAIAFPTARTELPISHMLVTRALFHMLAAGFAALGVALALSPNKKERTSTES